MGRCIGGGEVQRQARHPVTDSGAMIIGRRDAAHRPPTRQTHFCTAHINATASKTKCWEDGAGGPPAALPPFTYPPPSAATHTITVGKQRHKDINGDLMFHCL